MGFIDDIKVITGNKKDTQSEDKLHPLKVVLVVEDEKALADILDDRLTSEGFRVFKAANGKEGLELAIAHHPDVLLLDLMMPVMSGKSLLHTLRDMPAFKKLSVIVLTNAGEVENIRETQRYYDAVEFLIKSNVTMDEIVEKVKAFAW